MYRPSRYAQDSCYCSTISYSRVHTLPVAVRSQAHTFKYPKAIYRRSLGSGARTSTYGVEPCLWQERAGLVWSAAVFLSEDKILTARVHQPLHPLRLYCCGPHVCRNPGQNTRSTAGWAPKHFIIPGATLVAVFLSGNRTSAARAHLRLLPLRLYGCGPHVSRNLGQNTNSTAGCMHVSRLLQKPRTAVTRFAIDRPVAHRVSATRCCPPTGSCL